MPERDASEDIHCSKFNNPILSPIYDHQGNALTYEALCHLVNHLQDDVKILKKLLQDLVDHRNTFEGPSLQYMQGYRDGQQHIQSLAKIALKAV